jgi:DNA modification methylase
MRGRRRKLNHPTKENMEITFLNLEDIRPYERNPRDIPTQAIAKVANSIQTYGWRQPIVVDGERVIIIGHTRLLAAQKLGLQQAPVHIAENLTPEQVRMLRLADNRTHQETFWNEELLGMELLDLEGLGVDLDLTGFDMDEIDRLLGRDERVGLTDADAAPPMPESAISAPGDLWILGEHRVLCGDATDFGSLERVLRGERADMVFTDPPYNVDYRQPAIDPARAGRRIANDDLGAGFDQFLSEVCRHLLTATEGAIYICMSSSEIDALKRAFIQAGGHWSTFLIWAKNAFTLGRADYQRQYEPILYGWREGAQRHWCGARDQGDVWFVDKPARNDLHPTMKPVELIARAISNSSKKGASVLDPFGGSGSTMIACEKLNRRARLIELDPGYVDVAIMRWQDYAGAQATLDSDGRTFIEIAQERRPRAA